MGCRAPPAAAAHAFLRMKRPHSGESGATMRTEDLPQPGGPDPGGRSILRRADANPKGARYAGEIAIPVRPAGLADPPTRPPTCWGSCTNERPLGSAPPEMKNT